MLQKSTWGKGWARSHIYLIKRLIHLPSPNPSEKIKTNSNNPNCWTKKNTTKLKWREWSQQNLSRTLTLAALVVPYLSYPLWPLLLNQYCSTVLWLQFNYLQVELITKSWGFYYNCEDEKEKSTCRKQPDDAVFKPWFRYQCQINTPCFATCMY